VSKDNYAKDEGEKKFPGCKMRVSKNLDSNSQEDRIEF
jgi:hypothetical protein